MIPYGKHHIDEDDIKSVIEVLRSGILTQGPTVEAFENAIAEYVGAKYAIAVSSGTAALHLANLVANVKPGKSIVTSPITFVASANAARYCGGDVHFADIEPDTINISPQSLKEVLAKNSNIRAVVPVHFAGLPCDMDLIKTLSESAGAIVIEDAAHALGARYKNGKLVGCCENSLMTIFSFHPVKAIAAGEGGMITTNDENVYRRLLRLRSHGINKFDDPLLEKEQAITNGAINPWYYEMQELGLHYRITDIQCALALSQLRKIDTFVERRRELANQYDKLFSKINQCLPIQILGRSQSAHHLYVLRINFDALKLNRPQLMLHLRSQGIGTQVHYIPLARHPYYRTLGFQPHNYPNAESYYKEALTIPLFYDLTNEQQNDIFNKLQEILS